MNDKDWVKLAISKDPEGPSIFKHIIESPEDGGYLLATNGFSIHVVSDLDVPEIEYGLRIGEFLKLMGEAHLLDYFEVSPHLLIDALKGFSEEETIILDLLFSSKVAGHVLHVHTPNTPRQAFIIVKYRPEEQKKGGVITMAEDLTPYEKFKRAESTHSGFIIAVQNGEKFILFDPDCMLVSNFLGKKPAMVNRRWQTELTLAELKSLKDAYAPILHVVTT